MKPIQKMTIWQVRHRQEVLHQLRHLVSEYFSNSSGGYVSELQENQKALAARKKINLMLQKSQTYIVETGISTGAVYTAPAAIGGRRQSMDMLYNIFDLRQFNVGGEPLLDCIDRAIGVYDGEASRAILRTVNPFWWFGQVIDWLASLPFKLLGAAGFDQSKAEGHWVGRLVKAIGVLTGWAVSVLTVCEKLGYLDAVKRFVHR